MQEVAARLSRSWHVTVQTEELRSLYECVDYHTRVPQNKWCVLRLLLVLMNQHSVCIVFIRNEIFGWLQEIGPFPSPKLPLTEPKEPQMFRA